MNNTLKQTQDLLERVAKQRARVIIIFRTLKPDITQNTQGYWDCQNTELRLWGWGRTKELAIIAFLHDVNETYNLINHKDKQLTADAIALRAEIKTIKRGVNSDSS